MRLNLIIIQDAVELATATPLQNAQALSVNDYPSSRRRLLYSVTCLLVRGIRCHVMKGREVTIAVLKRCEMDGTALPTTDTHSRQCRRTCATVTSANTDWGLIVTVVPKFVAHAMHLLSARTNDSRTLPRLSTTAVRGSQGSA